MKYKLDLGSNHYYVSIYVCMVLYRFLHRSSFSQVSWEQPNLVNMENLGGRLMTSLTLHRRDRPYVIKSDLTIMPHVTLTIAPGAVLEFAPRVGILVLGTLVAKGRRHEEIVMKPLPNDIPASTEIIHNMYKR